MLAVSALYPQSASDNVSVSRGSIARTANDNGHKSVENQKNRWIERTMALNSEKKQTFSVNAMAEISVAPHKNAQIWG